MSGRLSPLQKPRCGKDQRAGTYTRDKAAIAIALAQPIENVVVLHDRCAAITTRYANHVHVGAVSECGRRREPETQIVVHKIR